MPSTPLSNRQKVMSPSPPLRPYAYGYISHAARFRELSTGRRKRAPSRRFPSHSTRLDASQVASNRYQRARYGGHPGSQPPCRSIANERRCGPLHHFHPPIRVRLRRFGFAQPPPAPIDGDDDDDVAYLINGLGGGREGGAASATLILSPVRVGGLGFGLRRRRR